MYKQLSDAYLGAAQAYAKLTEMEQIAITNKQIAETAQEELSLVKEQLASANTKNKDLDYKASEYDVIRNIFLQGSVTDFNSIKKGLASLPLDPSHFEDEDDYSEAIEYQAFLVKLADAMIEIRSSVEEF